MAGDRSTHPRQKQNKQLEGQLAQENKPLEQAKTNENKEFESTTEYLTADYGDDRGEANDLIEGNPSIT